MTQSGKKVVNNTEKWLPHQIEEFKCLAQPILLKAGSIIYEEESHPDFVFLIESGYIKLYQVTNLGKIAIMAIRIPGDLIGMSSLLLGKNWVYAECIGKCQLWKLEAKTFMGMLHNHSQLAIQIATELSKRLYDAQRTITNLSSLEVEHRLINLLVNLANSLETPGGSTSKINVYLTHQEMANMVGSCRQVITTTLGQLKDAEIINIRRRHIEIINFKKLKNMVN